MESCVRKKPANALPKHRHCRAGWHSHEVTSEAVDLERGRISKIQGYCATRHDAADTAQAAEKWRDPTQSREVFPAKRFRC